MKRYFEYGGAVAALLTLIYLIVAFVNGLTINITAIFLCIAGGIVTGIVVSLLLIYFSPGEYIPEGEEDNYIN